MKQAVVNGMMPTVDFVSTLKPHLLMAVSQGPLQKRKKDVLTKEEL